MISFEEMRQYARKVDEGVKYLEQCVSDPYKLSCVTTKSIIEARNTLDEMNYDLKDMKDNLEQQIKNELEEIQDTKDLITSVNDFIQDMDAELNEIESKFAGTDYVPFPKKYESNGSDFSDTVDKNGSDELVRKRELLIDESPVFATPNYNSTPDSLSCSSYNSFKASVGRLRQWSTKRNPNEKKDDQACSSNKNLKQNSDCSFFGVPFTSKKSVTNNRSILRNYTPPPMLPLSLRRKKNTVITPLSPPNYRN